jgi:hypothetical protein
MAAEPLTCTFLGILTGMVTLLSMRCAVYICCGQGHRMQEYDRLPPAR